MTPSASQVPSTAEVEHLRLFIANVTDYAIYMLSPEGIVTSWNAGAQRFKGYLPSEILGRHFSLFYTDEDRAAGRPAFALASARDTGKFDDEGWRVRKDGTRFWASVVLDPIRDEHGVLLGFTKITRDITEQRKVLEDLYASEERFRLLVQGVTDYAIYMLSSEGIVTNWNEGARRIKGYTADEAIGSHFSRFYTDEERDSGAPMRALETVRREGRFETEGWRRRKDGNRFWAHVIIDPILDSAGFLIGYAKVTRDVTERRVAEESLARARDALLQSQKLEAIGKLTGGIAHDINNLLNVMVNGIELLRRATDLPSQGKILDAMARASTRGENLIRQLLAFARQQPITPERINVNTVIDHFEQVLRGALPSGATLLVRPGQRLPDIMADTTQLEAAILNLVVNARDAIDGNGAITLTTDTIDGPLQGSALPAGAYVRLRLRDTGCGMPADVAARAIEPFFTTKEVGKGTGLGLSQVYGMTQQAGGDLQIWSEPGQGTEIAMLFPALAADPAAAGAVDQQEKVLIVDDQPDVLEMTADMFRSMGYDVLAAADGNAAMALVRQHHDLSLLFSDVVMPGMNGIDLAGQAVAQIPGLKVLLASGYLSTALQKQHADALKFEIISKPYRLADILKKLRSL